MDAHIERIPARTLIAAPSVLALIGILLNQRVLDRVESSLGKRIDRVQDGLRDANKRLDDVNKTLHSDFQGLLVRIADHGQRQVRAEERLK